MYFNSAAGLAIHNTIATASIALGLGQFAYVNLSETNDQVLSMTKATIGTGAASNFITYNRLLMGYRNAVDGNFYPEELAGVFARNIVSGDFVLKATFDAYTILAADTDNTPAALAVGASTVVGRKSTGGVVALSMSDLRTELGNLDGREQLIANASAATIDWSLGATARMTFATFATVALTFTNGSNGKVYRFLAKHTAGGAGVFTYSTTIKWRGGVAATLSTASNSEDILTFVYINGSWYGDAALKFASV